MSGRTSRSRATAARPRPPAANIRTASNLNSRLNFRLVSCIAHLVAHYAGFSRCQPNRGNARSQPARSSLSSRTPRRVALPLLGDAFRPRPTPSEDRGETRRARSGQRSPTTPSLPPDNSPTSPKPRSTDEPPPPSGTPSWACLCRRPPTLPPAHGARKQPRHSPAPLAVDPAPTMALEPRSGVTIDDGLARSAGRAWPPSVRRSCALPAAADPTDKPSTARADPRARRPCSFAPGTPRTALLPTAGGWAWRSE